MGTSWESLLFRLFSNTKRWPSRCPHNMLLTSDCHLWCLLKLACCAWWNTGQRDGGHLKGMEGVLSSLVHRCSPSLALSGKQDLERDPGLSAPWGGAYSPAVCSCPPSLLLLSPSLVRPPVLCWAHRWLPSVKYYIIHSPWILSYGFSLLRQSPIPVLGKTVEIMNATSARRGVEQGRLFKMSPGFACI